MEMKTDNKPFSVSLNLFEKGPCSILLLFQKIMTQEAFAHFVTMTMINRKPMVRVYIIR